MMKIGILGAGLAGISLAYLLQDHGRVNKVELLEKASEPGGLCRSFRFGNAFYDVGPHILFSKDQEILTWIVDLLGDNVRELRRSNKILHDGRLVKYPFENELSALSERDRAYCLNTFLQNPYERYTPQNMLQFFLATFGEGITNLYLRPYNEKIWKFDPAFMDTQMVDRIPKPPAEDIVRSADGVTTEGYVHQLYFDYPKAGGIEAVVQAFLRRFGPKTVVQTGATVTRVERSSDGWVVTSADGVRRQYDQIVSTIPMPDLIAAMGAAVPRDVAEAAGRLRFNSIAICCLRVRNEHIGDHLAVQIADKRVVFHRLTRLNYLAPDAPDNGTSTLMLEVTYRPGDQVSQLSDEQLLDQTAADLVQVKFIDRREDILERTIFRAQHAYVIYDLDHHRNTSLIRDYCHGQAGLRLHGRFGEFAYVNMDAVLRRSRDLYTQIREQL